MYTTHHPCWDAKNRHNLPDEMPFEYERIAHCFKDNAPTVAPHIEPTVSQVVTPPQKTTVAPPAPPIDNNVSDERKEFGYTGTIRLICRTEIYRKHCRI